MEYLPTRMFIYLRLADWAHGHFMVGLSGYQEGRTFEDGRAWALTSIASPNQEGFTPKFC
jgi:hypothetical protein